MSAPWDILFGPPGTGKTWELLRLLEVELAAGIPPEEVAFVTFTKKAANEARDRAKAKFNYPDEAFVLFRTLHSLAFRQLGLSKSQVINKDHFEEFGDLAGIKVTGRFDIFEGDSYGFQHGDRLLFLENLARLRMIDPLTVSREMGHEDIQDETLLMVSRELGHYKRARHILDYTDMLSMFLARGQVPPVKVVFVDEAQDLSPIQWRVVEKLCANAERVYIAGDDDQAIFRWAGADVDHFINLPGRARVLDQSYRIPAAVQTFANSLIERVGYRRGKSWRPRAEHGSLQFLGSEEQLDMSSGSWLILARNTYLLKRAEEFCREEGFLYEYRGRKSIGDDVLLDIIDYEKVRRGGHVDTDRFDTVLANRISPKRIPHVVRGDGTPLPIWHEAMDRISLSDREYLIAALRRGEKPRQEPRIKLKTIHSEKGGEADHVVLYPDMSPRTLEHYHRFPDDEARVFYVGATRSRQSLYVMSPRSSRYFVL